MMASEFRKLILIDSISECWQSFRKNCKYSEKFLIEHHTEAFAIYVFTSIR